MTSTRPPALFLSTTLFLLAGSATAQITPGNLVVERVGTGTAVLSNASTALFLDEYTTTGSPVQSIALPTAASGANLPCTNSGSATSEGILTLSPNGRFLVASGYGTNPGLASVASSASTTIPRVIARIGLDGVIDTSTSISNLFSANNIRSATTDDGLQFWAAGGNSGIVYTTLAATTGTSLNTTAPTNCRVVDIAGGQLYTTSGSGTTRGVIAVGTGLPTTAGQTLTLLPGFPTASASSYDFFFADANTVYVADDRASASGGGIQKWTLSAGAWSLQYTLTPGAVGCRGLSGYVVQGVTTLYATTTTSPLNELVSVVDLGSGPGTFTTLATAATNTALRGVRFINVPHHVSFSFPGSPTTVGIPTIAPANGLPVIGNTSFAIAAGNLVPNGFCFSLLDIGTFSSGFPVLGAPFTVLIYVNPLATQLLLADGSGNASMPLGIPALGALAGLPIPTQLVAFDTAMPDPVPIGTSGGMLLVVGF